MTTLNDANMSKEDLTFNGYLKDKKPLANPLAHTGIANRSDRARSAIELVRNLGDIGGGMFVRSQVLQFLLDGPRDIDSECGYPQWLTPDHYRAMYDREGISKRVVDCEPEETWAMDPFVMEDPNGTKTEFDRVFAELVEQFHVWHYLQRADTLSGIGQFGILLFGIDDGRVLEDPVEGFNSDGTVEKGLSHKLMWMRPFSEDVVFVKTREVDVTNPRYGLPTMYTIHFRDFPNWGIQAGEIIAREVHWSRVQHLADNRKMSEVYGVPRMQPVYNRLYDLRKIYAASGEAYWKTGLPGIAFEVNPELADQGETMDVDAIKKQMVEYQMGLQKYLALTGVTAKTMQAQMTDPTPTVETHLKAIAITKGIPFRVLFGSEEAKLASGQDATAWNKRVAKRQTSYVNPLIIRPFIKRMIAYGVLPEPSQFKIEWPDLNSPTDLGRAQVALAETQAMSAYVTGGVALMMPPGIYLRHVMGYTEEQVEAWFDGVEQLDSLGDDPEDGENQGQLGGGKPNTGDAMDQRTLSRQGIKKPVDAQIVSMPSLNKDTDKPRRAVRTASAVAARIRSWVGL